MSIILPMLTPMLVTAAVLLAVAVAKLYDLVIAMTKGGPGISSEVPAKFIMDNFFERSNVGLGSAAATVLLVTVVAIVAPWIYAEHLRPRGADDERCDRTSGPKPQTFSSGRLGVYAVLAVASLFFLTPLWVMLMTSFKSMAEIRDGQICPGRGPSRLTPGRRPGGPPVPG